MNPTVKAPRKPWKGRTILIWTVLGGAVVFALLSLISDLEALTAALSDFPLALLVPVALLSLGNYYLRYVKWHLYLRILGHTIPAWQNMLVFLSAFALTVTPGKVGEFVKAFILKRRFDVPYTASTAVLLMERFTDVAALIILSCLGLFLEFLHWSAAIIALGLMVGLILMLRYRPLARWMIAQTTRFRALKPLHDPLHTLYDDGWSLLEFRVLVPALAISVIAWFLEGAGYYLVARCFLMDVTLTESVFIYSAALLAGGLTLFAGGLLATEGGMVGLGMAFGMSRSISAAVTIIVRVMTLWFAVVIGWAVFLFTPSLRALLRASSTAAEGPETAEMVE